MSELKLGFVVMRYNLIIMLILIGILYSPLLCKDINELIRKSDKSLELGEYKEAIQYAEEALDQEKLKYGEESKEYCLIVGRLGNIYFSYGDMKKAKELFSEEINKLEQIDETKNHNYAIALNNLACVYQYLGKYKASEELLNQAIDMKSNVGSNEILSLSISKHNLARLRQLQGEYEESEVLYKESIELKNKYSGDRTATYANSLLNLGLLYQDIGNYKESEITIGKAVDIFEAELNKNDSRLKLAKLHLVLVKISLGDDAIAHEILSEIDKPENIYPSEMHPEYAQMMYSLAMIKWSQNKISEAKEMLENVLSITSKYQGNESTLYSTCLNSIGVLFWTSKMYKNAYKYLNEAVANRKLIYGENNPKYTTSIHNLAGLLSFMGKKDEAKTNYLKSIKLYQKHIDEYFPFLSEKEKKSFYSLIKERFDLFNCFVIENHEKNPELISEMFNNQIFGKAILLKDVINMRNSISNSSNKEILGLFDNWRNLKEEISKLYDNTSSEIKAMGKDLPNLETKVDGYEKKLSKTCSIFDQIYKREKPSWKDVKNVLEGDEAVVEIIRFREFKNGWTDKVYYVALVITKETIKQPDLFILNDDGTFENKFIHGYTNSIRFKIEDKYSYNAFWKVLDEYLEGKNKIYLSPDGIYNKININTLQKPDGSYIVDSKDISLIPNASDVINIKQRKEIQIDMKSVSLFGFPKVMETDENESLLKNWRNILDKYNIKLIPQTKVEVTEIDRLLRSEIIQSNLYIDDDASELRFKNIKEQNIVHIASHGFFLKDIQINDNDKIFGVDLERFIENPLLRSGVILSSGDKENGILTSYEVKNMDLKNTDLAVLSACETGAGEIINGEGVYGLQRAFQIAGAKSVVMSLWKISDLATQEFMVKFYEYLIKGLSPRDSLKMAQLVMKTKYKNPYYWGAFVMMSN